jgi:hypothetical protein
LTRRRLAAWAVFAVNVAHLLFDAAGGHEHILYPFSSLDGLPWLLCPLGTVALLGISAAISAGAQRPSRGRIATERPDAVAVG